MQVHSEITEALKRQEKRRLWQKKKEGEHTEKKGFLSTAFHLMCPFPNYPGIGKGPPGIRPT